MFLIALYCLSTANTITPCSQLRLGHLFSLEDNSYEKAMEPCTIVSKIASFALPEQ